MATTIAPTTTLYPATVLTDAQKCFTRRLYNANCVNNLIGNNWEQLLQDQEFIDAMRLHLAIEAVPVLEDMDDEAKVLASVNLMEEIIAKYE